MATNPLPQIGWDTVVVLDFLDQKPDRFQFILPIAKDAEDKKLIIVVSMLAIAETLHLQNVQPQNGPQIITEFFDRPFVHRVAAGLFVCERARDIRRAFKVDGADSIHLATAAETNTPIFLTNDGSGGKRRALLPLDGKVMLANGTPLSIMTPEDYDKSQRAKANPLLEASKAPIFGEVQRKLELSDGSGATAPE